MFALFEVQQLCLVPLSFVWTLLIYPQTGEQVNPAQQRQTGTAFSFEDFSQWRMSVSSRQSREITLTWCIVHRARVRGGGVLNLSKSCRLWRVSNVYAAWGGQCFQWIYCICPSLLAHATHIQGDESVAEQVTMKSLDVLWTDLVKQSLLNSYIIPNARLHN